jgi:hypothetical protein
MEVTCHALTACGMMATSIMPPTDVDSPRESLEYVRPSAGITRRQFRIFLWLLFINTIIFASSVFGPGAGFFRGAWDNYQERRAIKKRVEQQDALLQQAGKFTQAIDEVIYEENPAEAQRLLNSPIGYTVIDVLRNGGGGGQGGLFGGSARPAAEWQLPVLRTEPPIVTQLRAQFSQQTGEKLATILLHNLKKPNGDDRLVWITADAEQPIAQDNANPQTQHYSANTKRAITAFVIEKTDNPNSVPAIDVAKHHVTLRPEIPDRQTTFTLTESDDPQKTSFVIDPKGCFRFYAAQLDPKDPSHFTVDYALDGQRGTIDGYIKNDDSIIFAPRTGRITNERPDGKIWNPLAAPPTAPAN